MDKINFNTFKMKIQKLFQFSTLHINTDLDLKFLKKRKYDNINCGELFLKLILNFDLLKISI